MQFVHGVVFLMLYHLRSDNVSAATPTGPRGGGRQMRADLRAGIGDSKPKPIELQLHYIKPEKVV